MYVNQRGLLLLQVMVIVAEMMVEVVVQLMDRGDELMRRTYRVVSYTGGDSRGAAKSIGSAQCRESGLLGGGGGG